MVEYEMVYYEFLSMVNRWEAAFETVVLSSLDTKAST
jgi:hypothetical protein